jgi:Membrane proteins related to metalloendopeptidases
MAHRKRENNNQLRNKFRFSVFNDTTHKEIFTFRANGVWSIITLVLIILFVMISVTALISYTSLREFIPGYPSTESKRELIKNAMKIDSLENEVNIWRLQLANIQRIVTGKEPLKIDSLINISSNSKEPSIDSSKIAESDSLLRKRVMEVEQFNISNKTPKIEQIEGLHFFPPIKGVITQEYNNTIFHPYIDIAAEANAVISSILPGTVISAEWSDLDGYVIEIQHSNNLLSVYKHNAKLLKAKGDKVDAGTPIALAGNTGKTSMGVHLHFELWHNGEPINPATYIKF